MESSPQDLTLEGIVLGKSGIRPCDAYRNKDAGWEYGSWTRYKSKGKTEKGRIIITELPYMVNKARLVNVSHNYTHEKKIEALLT